MPRAKAATVLRVDGPVVLDWGNGVRIQLSPVGAQGAPAPIASAPPRKGAGRPPSAATLALREAMAKDAQAGHPGSRADYLALLMGAGGPTSPNAAGIIVNREAKRAFGHPLGRGTGKAASKGARKGARHGGRQASPATAALRAKLADDAAKGDLRDAPFYVRWVVDKANLGIRQARPIVYRELRAAKSPA